MNPPATHSTAKELPHIADRFKRSIISETAMRLAAKHGRLKMYSSAQVAAAMSAANFPAAWAGWAVAVFCTGPEFNDFCAAQGLSADYNNTRLDVLRFVDKPQASGSGGAFAVAGAAALVSGAALAGADDDQKNSGSSAGDAAEAVIDVVGGVFDVLDIFS